MSEIKITIKDAYLHSFLEFLQTLNYVQVQEVGGVGLKLNGAASSNIMAILKEFSADDPLLNAIQPMKKSVNIEALIKKHGNKKTDWERLKELAKDMDIQEPIEDLLAQLTA